MTGAKKSILCVDDEAQIVEFLGIMFEKEGYAVETSEGGWPAFQQIQAKAFDFVLSDVFFALKTSQPAVDSVVHFELDFAQGKPGRLSGTASVRWSRGASRHGFHPGVGLEIMTLDAPSMPFVLAEIEHTAPKAFVPIGYGRATANEP